MFCSVLTAALMVSACRTITPETGLLPPRAASVTIQKEAKLAKVVILDGAVAEDREYLESEMTRHIFQHIQEAGYFQTVGLLAGESAPHDLTLRFTFDRFHRERKVHPFYFPGLILTLTLYVWFGGPVHIDEYNVVGQLLIEDKSGAPLARARTREPERQTISIYDDGKALALKARTEIIDELLHNAVQELSGRSGIPPGGSPKEEPPRVEPPAVMPSPLP
jgi:hypothetical protein